MIDWLEIRELAIAAHLELEFGRAFTAVTGETGSGKSLIVDALGVLLGGRCENSMIRAGQPQAEITAAFALDEAHPALQKLREFGLDSARECILRRVVRRDKPSRAFINARAVTAAQLRELGRDLADIHGQHEHHSLLSRAGQLALLDAAAGNAENLAQLGREYSAVAETRARIDELRADDTRARAELLKMQIDELENLAPTAEEWPELEQRQKRMHHERELAEETRAVAAKLTESEDSMDAEIAACCKRLQRLLEYDPRLAKIVELMENAGVQLGEAAVQLQELYAGGAPDAQSIADVESRFSRYHDLSRKHRVLPGLLAEKLESLRAERESLQDPQAALQNLEAQLENHRAAYAKTAAKISKRRTRTAAELAESATALMQELGMAGGALEIRLHAEPGAFSRRGNETAEFAASANPGLPPQPLAKTASGGELSRISLAINVALAARAPASTLIFDEVDVGIGGRVAEVVGEKLRNLGDSRQIICITHLSQVAAKGHHHWSVQKRGAQTGAEVTVRALDSAQRVEEIARMVAGAEVTPQSRAHAMRMLQSA